MTSEKLPKSWHKAFCQPTNWAILQWAVMPGHDSSSLSKTPRQLPARRSCPVRGMQRGVARSPVDGWAGKLVMSMDAKCPCPCATWLTLSIVRALPLAFFHLFASHVYYSCKNHANVLGKGCRAWTATPRTAPPSTGLWSISSKAKCPLMVMGPKCAFQPCQLLDPRFLPHHGEHSGSAKARIMCQNIKGFQGDTQFECQPRLKSEIYKILTRGYTLSLRILL